MAKQTQESAPRRPTAEASFIEFKKEIAQRNETAQKEGRKRRAAREQEQLRRRRQDDVR